MKRILLTLVLILTAFPAYADICTADACGHWYSPKLDVLVGPSTLTWTNGITDECSIFAQDRHVTILECDEHHHGKRQFTKMYYFLQALGDDLHVRSSPDLPSCIARRSCWTAPGADFYRLSQPSN